MKEGINVMSKIAIVFWSGTGNTELMANAVMDGVKSAGGEGILLTPSDFAPEMLNDYDGFAFGCPSMGAEQLEESEFEPMFSALESGLSGKKIALFGSYGWGDGEWMRNWEETCKNDGAELVYESVIANETPDGDAIESCRNLGKSLI